MSFSQFNHETIQTYAPQEAKDMWADAERIREELGLSRYRVASVSLDWSGWQGSPYKCATNRSAHLRGPGEGAYETYVNITARKYPDWVGVEQVQYDGYWVSTDKLSLSDQAYVMAAALLSNNPKMKRWPYTTNLKQGDDLRRYKRHLDMIKQNKENGL